MAYGTYKKKSQNTAVRLTGLFKSRTRQGLAVGTIDGENLDNLITKIKAAKAVGRGVTVFLWSNPGKNPPFSVSADVAQERQQRAAKAAAIEDDDSFDDSSEDNLFDD